jgi:hypothetical protein
VTNATPRTREVIIRVAEPDGNATAFLRPPWSARWTTVWRHSAERLAHRVGPHLRLRPGMSVPQFHGAAPALWLSEIEQLETALADATWTKIVFEPSPAAALDAFRLGRESLVARRALSAGHILGRDDIAIVVGGPGVSATAADVVVGRTLRYDLNADEPITFGMIEVGP